MPWRIVRPYLCQYLFECQSTLSVSSVLTGGRYHINRSRTKSSLDWFVAGYSIAHSSAVCLWNVRVGTLHQTEMLAKGLKYTLESQDERRISLAEGQNSTPPKKAGGRIECLDIVNPSDIMYTFIPYTQHLTQLTFCGNLPNNLESLFNWISIHNPMLEDLDLDVQCYLARNELLPLVSNLAKLGNLVQLELALNEKLLDNAKSLSAFDCLQSCPLLKEVFLSAWNCQALEIPSSLFSCLKPLLVNKLEDVTLESIALNSSAAEALSHSLQSQYCSLVTLRLHHCRLLNNASEQLVIGIGRNTSLHSIAFFACQLCLADFKILADALRNNKTLKEVEIVELNGAMMIDNAAIQALKHCNQNIAFELDLF